MSLTGSKSMGWTKITKDKKTWPEPCQAVILAIPHWWGEVDYEVVYIPQQQPGFLMIYELLTTDRTRLHPQFGDTNGQPRYYWHPILGTDGKPACPPDFCEDDKSENN